MKRLLGTLLGLSLAAVACGDTVNTPGQLVLALQTDMRLPDDVDEVRIEVTRFGKLEFGQTYEVGEGKVKVPATLTFIAGPNPSDPIQIRVIALRDKKPEVLRQATTTIPANRVAMLRMPLQWVCYGTRSVMGDSEGTATSTCETGKTCIAGACVDETVDSTKLEDYDPASLFGGGAGNGNGQCFEVDKCLAPTLQRLEPLHGVTTTDGVSSPSCAVAKPAGADESLLNVGIFVRPGGDICEETGCVVPIDRDSALGWTLVDDTIQLPLSLCTLAEAGKIDVMVSAGCPSKSNSLPTCGAWSSSGNEGATGYEASNASEGGPLLSDTKGAVTAIAIGGEGLSSRAYFATEGGQVSGCDALGCQSRLVYKTATNVKEVAGTATHFIYAQPDTTYDFLYRCSVREPLTDCVSFAHKTPGQSFVAVPEAGDSATFWFTEESGQIVMKGTLAAISDGIGTIRYQVPAGSVVRAFRASTAELVWIEEGAKRELKHCAKPLGDATCSAFVATSELTGIVPSSLTVAGTHVSWLTDAGAIVSYDLANPTPSPVAIGSGALVAAAMSNGVFLSKADRTVRFVSYGGKEIMAFTAPEPVVTMAVDDTNLFYATNDHKLWRYTHGR